MNTKFFGCTGAGRGGARHKFHGAGEAGQRACLRGNGRDEVQNEWGEARAEYI